MQKLIDRIAGQFGFQRVTAAPANDTSPVSSPAPGVPAHLRDESLFDWGRASARNVSFSYNEGDSFHFAVGKPGWMPLAVAAFAMAGNRTDGQTLMSRAIADSLWLDPSSERYASWLFANENTFEALQEIKGAAESAGPQFTLMSSTEVSYVFRQQWRQRFPSSGEDYLAISEAHSEYYKHPEIADAHRAIDAAYARTLELMRQWFEAHGFEVSDDQKHIGIAAYQPLFYVAEQSY